MHCKLNFSGSHSLFRRAAGARRNVFPTSILPSLEEMSFTNILTEEALNLLKYISFQIYSYYGFWQVTVTSLSDIFGSLSIFLIGVHSPRTLTYTWHRVRTLFSGSNQYLTVGSRGPPTADPSPARVIGHRHRRRMTTMPPGRLSVTYRCYICVFTDVDLTSKSKRNTDISLISSELTKVEILRRTLCSSSFSLLHNKNKLIHNSFVAIWKQICLLICSNFFTNISNSLFNNLSKLFLNETVVSSL